MYVNYSKLNNLSKSIVWIIIDIVIAVFVMLIGAKFTGMVLTGFILLCICFVLFAISNIFLMLKCIKYGNESAFKDNNNKDKTLTLFNNMTSILSLVGIACFVTGIILMLR